MTVTRDGAMIRLQGPCRVEDAEPLVALMQRDPGLPLDLSACESLHTAVVQAILAFRPAVTGLPADAFLRNLLLPALSATSPRAQGPDTKRQPDADPI